jgi:signal transduction histidine kinase
MPRLRFPPRGQGRADLVLAAGLVAGELAVEGATGSLTRYWTVTAMVVGCGAALARRQRWPLPAAVLCAGSVFLPVVFRQDGVFGGPVEVLLLAPFLLAYTLGRAARLGPGVAGAVILAASLQASTSVFNPFFVMITLGPWLAGRIIRSRHRLAVQLSARNLELEAERERFARESVRYERARIARELHDMVGHSVSVIVVQARAGQRLAGSDPEAAGEAFHSIAAAVRDARAEISQLVDLLAAEPAGASPADLALIDELVRRADRAGLDVSCRWTGSRSSLAPVTANAAYRIVQESLTNALKHAPGAPVQITLHGQDGHLEIEVINGAARQHTSGLERSGSGQGLTGMRERAAACGGTVTAARTAADGWRVAARLPVSRPAPG